MVITWPKLAFSWPGWDQSRIAGGYGIRLTRREGGFKWVCSSGFRGIWLCGRAVMAPPGLSETIAPGGSTREMAGNWRHSSARDGRSGRATIRGGRLLTIHRGELGHRVKVAQAGASGPKSILTGARCRDLV